MIDQLYRSGNAEAAKGVQLAQAQFESILGSTTSPEEKARIRELKAQNKALKAQQVRAAQAALQAQNHQVNESRSLPTHIKLYLEALKKG